MNSLKPCGLVMRRAFEYQRDQKEGKRIHMAAKRGARAQRTADLSALETVQASRPLKRPGQ